MSSAYRKPDTCWQHHAALNGGMTYSKRARATTHRIRIRRIRVTGLLVVIAASQPSAPSCWRPRPRRPHHPSTSFAVSTVVFAVNTVVFAVSTVVRLARLTVPSPTARRSLMTRFRV